MYISLSVIIPCYNAERYIERCLDSVVRIEGCEIILVDDMSEDNTVSCVEAYIANHQDNDIKLVKNTVNKGAGESRNIGISYVTREYLTFIDADDEFRPAFFEEISNTIHDQGMADCIVFDAMNIVQNSEKYMKMFFSAKIIEGMIAPEKCFVYIKGTTWGKVYRTEVIKKNAIRFGTIKRNEDMIFTKSAIMSSQSIYYTNKALYNYYDVPTSLMNNVSLLDPQNAISAYTSVEAFAKERYREELEALYIIEVIYGTIKTKVKQGKSANDLIEHYRKIRKNVPHLWRNKYLYGFPKKYLFVLMMCELKCWMVLRWLWK